MASNPAVDEYNALMSRNSRSARASHPEDDASDILSETTTLAASYKSKPSLRSSTQSSKSRMNGAARPKSASGSFYHHEEDDEGDSSSSDGENSAPAHTRKPSKYYLPSTYDRDAMTGPKGVIADAQAFEREKRGKRSSDFQRTVQLALPRSQSYGGTNSSGGDSRKGSASEGPGEDSSDDEVLRRWRERRVEELKTGAAERRKGSRRREPVHGGLENVSPDRFLEAVETAGRGATVVVYIFDDTQSISDAYATPIAQLAAKYTSVHFVALHHLDAQIDQAGVPALLAYRNGDLFADVMPLAEAVPLSRNTASVLEGVMRERGMLR